MAIVSSGLVQTCRAVQSAEPGMSSHGYITGVKPYGVFISFCGGVKGLAHTAELPLAPDQKPSDAYAVGQVRLRSLHELKLISEYEHQ